MGKIDLNLMLTPKHNARVLESVKEKKFAKWEKDETMYTCSHDNGTVNISEIIFLPSQFVEEVKNEAGEIEQIPHNTVQWFRHWFQQGNQKIIEPCPRFTNSAMNGNWDVKCPICEYNDEVNPYRTDATDAEQKERGKLKAKNVGLFVNVYVKSDALNPENNGKVFKMKMPWQVADKFHAKIRGVENPEKTGYSIDPENVMDISGKVRPMRLIAKPHSKNTKWNDYADSEFLDKIDFMGGDKGKIMEVLSKTYDLYSDIIKPAYDVMKTPDQLIALIDGLFGTNRAETDAEVDDFNSKIADELKKDKVESDAVVDDIPAFETSTVVDEKPKEDYSEDIPAFDPSQFNY